MVNKFFRFGMLILMVSIGFLLVGCPGLNGGGDNKDKEYKVTIGVLTNANGSVITASPTVGVEGI
jgi:hypothetical protein